MPRPSLVFRPASRLKKSAEFACLQAKGARVYSKHFLLLIAKSDRPSSRLGITVTRKIDRRACVRNRLKRQLREIFRLNRERFKGSFDILVIARQNASQCNYRDIKREILGAFYHHGLFERTRPDNAK